MFNEKPFPDESPRWWGPRIPILGMTILEFIVLVVVVVFIRGWVFQLFRVNGPSMCPTLNFIEEQCQNGSGELVFVNQWGYHLLDQNPKRGEVVVFHSPIKNIFVIKRILGVAGDEIRIHDGDVYIKPANGEEQKLKEPYLNEFNTGNTRTLGKNRFVVPEGQYFLMGDNRSQSLDGRHCYNEGFCKPETTSFIKKEEIKGKAMFSLYPFSMIRKIEVLDAMSL